MLFLLLLNAKLVIMADNLKKIPNKCKKFMTLIGGFLIHLSFGSLYTNDNLNPYVTSFMREFNPADNIRYSDAIWNFTSLLIPFSISVFLSGLSLSIFKINVKFTILIGCILSR